MIDVLDDMPYNITEIFNKLLCIRGFNEKIFCRVDGLKLGFSITSDVRGVVISGSIHHIYDQGTGKDWKDALCEFVRVNHNKIPILGICFGHQVIAQALGGEVAPHSYREIGTVPIYITPDARKDPLFNGFKDGNFVPESHIDHVIKLPPRAVRLAYNSHSPNQAFNIGKSWGIQFHPELQSNLFKQLLAGRVKKLREEGKILEANMLQNISESVQECPWAVKILKRFISFCLAEI